MVETTSILEHKEKSNHYKIKNEIFWVDLIRASAIIFVIFLHAAAPAVFEFGNTPIENWWVSNFFDSATRMSVPLFFMISGYLLLSKQETITSFFIKRFNKVFLPFITWIIIYMLFDSQYMGREYSLNKAVTSFLEGPVYVHLWFLYALINLYFFIPILRIFVRSSANEGVYYFITLWFLAASIIPIIRDVSGINIGINFPMFSGFSGYFVLGWLVGNKKMTLASFYLSIILFLVSLFVTCFGTYLITQQNNAMDEYFYTYLSPNVVFMSLSSFSILKYLGEEIELSQYVKKVIQIISSYAFGIYLIHIAVLQLMADGFFGYRLDGLVYPAIFSVPLTAVVAFLISFIMVMLLKRIPIIKSQVP